MVGLPGYGDWQRPTKHSTNQQVSLEGCVFGGPKLWNIVHAAYVLLLIIIIIIHHRNNLDFICYMIHHYPILYLVALWDVFQRFKWTKSKVQTRGPQITSILWIFNGITKQTTRFCKTFWQTGSSGIENCTLPFQDGKAPAPLFADGKMESVSLSPNLGRSLWTTIDSFTWSTT